jgi:hypothetical protein
MEGNSTRPRCAHRSLIAALSILTAAVTLGCSPDDDQDNAGDYSCTADGRRDVARLMSTLAGITSDVHVTRESCDSGGPAGVMVSVPERRRVLTLLTQRFHCGSFEIVGDVTQTEPRVLMPCTIDGIRAEVDVDQAVSPNVAWIVPERARPAN